MAVLTPLRKWFRNDRDNEISLTEEARGGSRLAFDALMHVHGPRVRRFLVRQVGTEAADDVFQETWIACWASLPRLTPRVGFRAWLYGIAANKCRDHYRRQAKAATAWLAFENAAHSSEPSWEDQFALREEVQSVLLGLPTEQREVVEMYYYAELTLPEIAAALERNLNTVKYQFYRGHARVAEGLVGTSGDTIGASKR